MPNSTSGAAERAKLAEEGKRFAQVPATLLFVGLAVAGCMRYFAGFVLLPIGLASIAVPFVLGGQASAGTVAKFCRRGKNRNVDAAVASSVLACSLAVLSLWVCFYYLGAAHIEEFLGEDGRYVTGVSLLIALLGGVIAGFSAKAKAKEIAQSDAFCESCNEFMHRSDEVKLTLGALKAMVRAMKENKIATAASLLLSGDGNEGVAVSYRCAGCGKGFLDVTLCCTVYWLKDGGKKNREEKRRVLSAELGAGEMQAFLLFHPSQTEPPHQAAPSQ